MDSFGTILRRYRRQCHDPIFGGQLTQARLGELIGDNLGDSGYTGAAVSEWERDRSRIAADQRPVLIGLVQVLEQCGGLASPEEANALLHAGEYRGLNQAELDTIFPNLAPVQTLSTEAADELDVGTVTYNGTGSYFLDAERKKQHILLQKVHDFWIQSVLERILEESPHLKIEWEQSPESVDHPWKNLPDQYTSTAEIVPQPDTLLEMFFRADRAMIILGAPGSGKTIFLLRLAQDLIRLAQADETQPIPVILNLASWAENRASMDEWIVDELTAKYQIPKQLGMEWLQNDQLLLLLDGLDLVDSRYRDDCVAAINQFRTIQGLTGLVVCSRHKAYAALNAQLRLRSAILIKPLSTAAIESYVESISAAVSGDNFVRVGPLHDLVRSPLFLNLFTRIINETRTPGSVESDHIPGSLTQETDHDVLQNQLFADYVDQVLSQQDGSSGYSKRQALSWLGWIASQMHVHNQSIFMIEGIQPSWLSSRGWRTAYLLWSRLTDSVVFALALWFLALLFAELVPGFDVGLADASDLFLALPAPFDLLAGMLLLNVTLGTVMFLLYWLLFSRVTPQSSRFSRRAWRRWHTLLIGSTIGVVTWILMQLWGEPALALGWGIAEALLFGLFTRYAYGSDYRDEIRISIPLSWSWSGAVKGFAIGFVVSAVAELIETNLYGDNGYLPTLIAFGFGAFLLGGLTGQQLRESVQSVPGFGFAIRNSIYAALLAGTLSGLATGLSFADVRGGLFCAAFMITLVLPLYGGFHITRHYMLRFILRRQGVLPGRYRDFLEYVVRSTLMYQVGSGFLFIHPLFQDYLRSDQTHLGRASR